MKPVLEDDELLQWDVEGDEEESTPNELSVEDKLRIAEKRAERCEDDLKRVVEDMHVLQESARNLFSASTDVVILMFSNSFH